MVFEKVISCFARHSRNLYDNPDFVIHDVVRFGNNLDLLIQTSSKDLLLARIGKLKLPYSTLRCRPIQLQAWKSNYGFAAWLVSQYGLDNSDPGRRRLRVNQRRPIGNNLLYHVWNRTVHKRLLFGPAEKEILMRVTLKVCSEMKVQLHAFVIMGNHYHLVITTQNDVSISELMQRIDWRISVQYNRLHQTQGTLWEGPFRHKVYQPTLANLVRLIDYIHANPLRAGLVTEPALYRWSSYLHYTGVRRRKGLVTPLAIRRRWPKKRERESFYQDHFAKQMQLGKLKHDPDMETSRIQGSEAFRKTIISGLSGPARLPAFVKHALQLKKEGVVWGIKTLLHLLCRPLVERWLRDENRWKTLTDRLEPLLPVCPAPS